MQLAPPEPPHQLLQPAREGWRGREGISAIPHPCSPSPIGAHLTTWKRTSVPTLISCAAFFLLLHNCA